MLGRIEGWEEGTPEVDGALEILGFSDGMLVGQIDVLGCSDGIPDGCPLGKTLG